MVLNSDRYKALGGRYGDMADFDAVEKVAEDVVDALLFFGISKGQLTDSDKMWSYVEKAVVMQMDFIMQSGGLDAYLDNEKSGDVASESVAEGGVSQSTTYLAGGERELYAGGLHVSKRAVGLLGSVGLIYRMRVIPGGFRR